MSTLVAHWTNCTTFDIILQSVSLKTSCNCNGFEFRDYFRIGKTRGWGWCIVYKSSVGKIGDSSGGCSAWGGHGSSWLWLAQTSSYQLLRMTSEQCSALHIWFSNNADVLLDSGLNLFDIVANLCSKLYCEVLLKSWNYVVYLLKWTSALDFNERGCVATRATRQGNTPGCMLSIYYDIKRPG